MKKHSITCRALVTTTAIATFAGCGTIASTDSKLSSGATPGYPVTTTNCGRDITVSAPPERVVSMHPSITELLVQLRVEGKVVAQAQDALGEPSPALAAAVRKIPSISADAPPNRELLLTQRPDLVLSGTEYEFGADMGFASYDDLTAAGAQTYVATAGCQARRSKGTVDDTLQDLRFLGKVFGVEKRAAQVEQQARTDLEEVAEIVGDAPPVRAAQVYVEGGKLYAIGGAVEIDILRLGGGSNVFAPDDSRFADFFAAEINSEVLLDKAPDALVFAVTSADHEAETRKHLIKTLADTPAVRNGRLVAIDNTYVQPGTLSAITGARLVAKGLHG